MKLQFTEIVDDGNCRRLINLSNITDIKIDEDGYAVIYLTDGRHINTAVPYDHMKKELCYEE